MNLAISTIRAPPVTMMGLPESEDRKGEGRGGEGEGEEEIKK